jgi:hypothetical protein
VSRVAEIFFGFLLTGTSNIYPHQQITFFFLLFFFLLFFLLFFFCMLALPPSFRDLAPLAAAPGARYSKSKLLDALPAVADESLGQDDAAALGARWQGRASPPPAADWSAASDDAGFTETHALQFLSVLHDAIMYHLSSEIHEGANIDSAPQNGACAMSFFFFFFFLFSHCF